MDIIEASRILIISDLHVPYHHKDAFGFLSYISEKIKPDLIINIGDEVDHHAINFHQHDPDLLSPGEELKKAITYLQELYELFPKMLLLESNHGSMVYRKGKFHGLPRAVFKSYREMLEAPVGWEWHDTLLVKSGNQMVWFEHGRSARPLALSNILGCSTVQGHFHNSFAINWWANHLQRYFSMHTGCLIDASSLAFAYNKTNLLRPQLGCSAIVDGEPILFPMPF